MASTDTTASKHQCPKCSRSFKRLEHLRRHERGHEEGNKLACSFCPKKFTRKDIRNRHESMHRISDQTSHSVPGRRRACLECARARERCSKGNPCTRCSSRSLACAYPQDTSLLDGVRHSITGFVRRSPRISQNQETSARPEISINFEACSPTITSESTEETSSQVNIGNSYLQVQNVLSCPLVSGPQQDGNTYEVAAESTYPALQPFKVGPGAFAPPPLDSNIGEHGIPDVPMNWLQTDETIDLDYSSLLGIDFDPSSWLSETPSGQTLKIGLPAGISDPRHVEPQTELSLSGNTRVLSGSDPTLESGSEPLQSFQPMVLGTPVDWNGEVQVQVSPASAASPAGTVSTASRISLERNSRLTSRGGLYATSSNGARIPCTVWSKRKPLTVPGSTPLKSVSTERSVVETENEFRFPDLSHISVPSSGDRVYTTCLRSEMYSLIKLQYQRLCTNVDGVHTKFASQGFPTLEQFDFFIYLYFQHFDPILPVYCDRVASLNEHWVLCLAITAVGAQYTETEEFSSCSMAFYEFLRRAIASELEAGRHQTQSFPLVQAILINHAGTIYQGSRRLSSLAKASRGLLVDSLHSLDLLAPTGPSDNSSTTYHSAIRGGGDVVQRWTRWLSQEARRRLGYAIWLLDCMSAYHFGIRPLLTLESAKAELPHDGLWAAQTAEEWDSLMASSDGGTCVPTLLSTVQTLFIERQMSLELGEYSNLLILHGVYQELFKVKEYFGRQLSAWAPSAQKASTNLPGSDSQDGPSETNSALQDWKSAALDCVDVLHWSACSTIAQLSGAEHATVLHLHFSRVVLLVPYEKLKLIATRLASLIHTPGDFSAAAMEEVISAQKEVLEWAQRDEHKARLAALHSGTVFWHLRRYSCNAFYEPISAFLATLALWAYSLYASRAPLPRPSRADDEIPNPSFIHLDRPCDDEIVQFFVRSGRPSAVQAFIAGVGDIYGPDGPAAILSEGRKLVKMVSRAWGRSKEYVQLLEAVERYTIDCRSNDNNRREN